MGIRDIHSASISGKEEKVIHAPVRPPEMIRNSILTHLRESIRSSPVRNRLILSDDADPRKHAVLSIISGSVILGFEKISREPYRIAREREGSSVKVTEFTFTAVAEGDLI